MILNRGANMPGNYVCLICKRIVKPLGPEFGYQEMNSHIICDDCLPAYNKKVNDDMKKLTQKPFNLMRIVHIVVGTMILLITLPTVFDLMNKLISIILLDIWR